MRANLFGAVAVTALLFVGVGAANAQVNLQGDYVETTVNTAGSLASLKHDPTGTGNPGVNDYITPGSPHDGFSINSDQTGFQANDNNAGGGSFGNAVVTDLSGGAFDLAATVTVGNAFVSITNLYEYNTGDQRINVTTTVTALQTLTNLAFARSVDPDPDVNTSGSFGTNNQRGNLLFGVTDFVGAAGPDTGLTLGLLNLSGNAFAHNTAIGHGCCSNIDPNLVLTGYADSGFADDSINMAWLIGTLSTGSSATIKYAYVVGDNIEVVGGGIPEPATWGMMILGFMGVGGMVRRRRTALA